MTDSIKTENKWESNEDAREESGRSRSTTDPKAGFGENGNTDLGKANVTGGNDDGVASLPIGNLSREKQEQAESGL